MQMLDCAGLGWDAEAVGHLNVCGSSILVGQLGSSDMCVREAVYSDAAGLCMELGSRLCTVSELSNGEGRPESCGYDSGFVWSWAAPDSGMDLCANGSLGVAGRPGEWYSFLPGAASAYHEVRLLSEGALISDSRTTFTIDTDIFDSNAERVTTPVSPTLHHRPDGIMLRWNVTAAAAAAGRFYLRASASVLH